MGIRDAVDGAIKAANESGLPQGVGGPADAYRHLLIAGELRRRFGPRIGASLTSAYEFLNRLEGQSELNRRMDDFNNAVVHNAPDFRTFEDLQRWARGEITEAAPFSGDGLDGRVMWHRKPARGWRPDWSNVPLLSIERGGAEHHWSPEFGSGIPGGIAAADPFDRVLAAWSEEDIAAIMRSRPYLESAHPDHAQAQVLVRAWFVRNYGAGPAASDARGRLRRDVAGRRGSAARAVHVRAHTRSWPD
ncbi:MAG: hypothetical protein ACREJ0_15430 [Geminicoccaceae bacterium]